LQLTDEMEAMMSKSNDDDVKRPKEKLSRRAFLSTAGTVGAAVTLSGSLAASTVAEPPAERIADDEKVAIPGTIAVALRVNGETRKVRIDPRSTLLDTLRESCNLTGTKKGCDHGQCGACTVHINGRRVNSCLTFAAMHQGDEITTIEGIGQPGNLHAMQAAFVEHDGFQCGYCTSGQIMSAVAMTKEPWGPEDRDVKEAMAGNICRCGAYPNIVSAIQQVRGNSRRNG
jgi:xanthine dehydrogenase YagT iron-sulfur-binding subunit